MAKVRRRVLRPVTPVAPAAQSRHLARTTRKRKQLATERAALTRWMTKLRRAFHAVEKLQARIARLERQLADLDRAG